MSQPFPYFLKNGKTSDAYYQDIAAFTDRWQEKASQTLPSLINHYLAWQKTRAVIEWSQSPERTYHEAVFELLVLGVLLREHGAQAVDLPSLPAWLLTHLIEAQDNFPLPAIETPIKAVRGWVQGLATTEDDSPEQPIDQVPFNGGAADLVEKLVEWLNSAGVAAQAERMARWQAYFKEIGEQSAQAVLARSLMMADEFAEESETDLGKYTNEVTGFILCHEEETRWRYDAPLITRTRVEYHLAMLGTEVLTRAYRQRYLAMKRKIVIVPDCLCAHSNRVKQENQDACKAEMTHLGLKCAGCTPGCKVFALTRLAEKNNFEIYILPDDFRGVGLGACRKLSETGVVGVSCLLTNWDAGWQVNDAGVPVQGVLLDYAGCKNHWTENGETTDLNFKKLLEVVGV